jgi:hypothetical protein
MPALAAQLLAALLVARGLHTASTLDDRVSMVWGLLDALQSAVTAFPDHDILQFTWRNALLALLHHVRAMAP